MSDAKRHGIFGASESGKSAYVKAQLKDARRIAIFDPRGEYDAGPRSMPGIKRAKSVDQMRRIILDDWSGFRVSYVPPVGKEARGLSQICKLLMKAQSGYRIGTNDPKINLIADELATAFPSHGGITHCPGFAEICRFGRHFGIEVFGLTQRTHHVHPEFRDNLSSATVFRMGGREGRKAAAEIVDVPLRSVEGLEPLYFIRRDANKITRGHMAFAKNARIGKIVAD